MAESVEAASAGTGKTAEVVAEVVAEGENLTKVFEAARKEQDPSAKLLEWERTAGTADVATLKDQLKRQLLSGRFHESLVTLERLIEVGMGFIHATKRVCIICSIDIAHCVMSIYIFQIHPTSYIIHHIFMMSYVCCSLGDDVCTRPSV